MTNIGIVKDDFKSLRIQYGLSQLQVATALGITKPYISMIDNGKVAIPQKLEERLKEYFLEASIRAG